VSKIWFKQPHLYYYIIYRPSSSEAGSSPSLIPTVRPMLENVKNTGDHRPSAYATRGTETDMHLRRLNGQSKSENNFHNNHKEVSANFPRSSSSTSGGEPLATYLSKSKADHHHHHYEDDNNLTVCPYCSRRFGIEESISGIKNHIEMHIFAGDTTLA